jgi:hypothetical protein
MSVWHEQVRDHERGIVPLAVPSGHECMAPLCQVPSL